MAFDLRANNGVASWAVLTSIFFSLCQSVMSQDELPKKQSVETFTVQIVDSDGEPVVGAEVEPWALRYGSVHGLWNKDVARKGAAEDIVPAMAKTDAEGMVEVSYPFFGNFKMRIPTTSVSVAVEHPDFAHSKGTHVNLPVRDDFNIELHEGRLSVSGERTAEETVEGRKVHRAERSFGKFVRNFKLGHDVDAEKVSAEYKDGVLHIVVGKSALVQPKKIVVK